MLLNKVTIESSTAVLIFLVYLALPSHGAKPGVAVPRVASKLPKMMDIPRRVVNSQMISQYLGGPSSALDKLNSLPPEVVLRPVFEKRVQLCLVLH